METEQEASQVKETEERAQDQWKEEEAEEMTKKVPGKGNKQKL